MIRLTSLLILLLGTKVVAQDIVIVDIGFDNRVEVGREIRAIAACNPKIIATDVIYDQDSASLDTVLVNAIHKSSNVVMAAKLLYRDMPYPFWDSLELPNEKFGVRYIAYSNIYSEDGKAIAEISIQESYKGRLMPSLSYEVARRSEPQLKAIEPRSIKLNRLQRPKFKIIQGRDLLNKPPNQADFRDKIVLLGFLGERFAFKGKKTTSGVELQAYFIEYLLRHYTNK
jgi:CHASE2 domain-containing sensor protein